MRLLAKLAWISSLVVAAATYPVVAILAAGATDAYIIAAKSPELVKFNEDSFDAREPKETDVAYRKRVMEIYGNPIDYTTPVVFVTKEKFIRPPKAPELILLPVDKQKGENPLQVKSLYFFAKYVAMGSGASFAVFLALFFFLRKPEAKPAPVP
jgi:hypothetical protein